MGLLDPQDEGIKVHRDSGTLRRRPEDLSLHAGMHLSSVCGASFLYASVYLVLVLWQAEVLFLLFFQIPEQQI